MCLLNSAVNADAPRAGSPALRVRARHKMQVPEMQRQYGEWEITGAPEIRHVTETSTQPFSPFEPPARAIIAPMLLWTRDASGSDT